MKRDPRCDAFAQLLAAAPGSIISQGDRLRTHEHVADALAAVPMFEAILGATSSLGATPHIVDVGSGGGVPGIPLALALPSARLTMVESRTAKCDFLRSAIEQLELSDRVTVIHGRIEELTTLHGPLRGAADIATSRALAAPVVALELLAPCVRDGGTVVSFATAPSYDASSGRLAAELLGLAEPSVVSIASPLRDNAALIVAARQAPLPERFPRRTGMAAKRPLRA